jgi:MFS transporter, BCD family, chlorophyll transporter
MFDLTVPEKVGLYIGAWGFSNGLSRLVGLLMAGVVADLATQLTGDALHGYLVVFGIEALMIFIRRHHALSHRRGRVPEKGARTCLYR